MIELLLKNGADVEEAMFWADYRYDTEMVRFLKEYSNE